MRIRRITAILIVFAMLLASLAMVGEKAIASNSLTAVYIDGVKYNLGTNPSPALPKGIYWDNQAKILVLNNFSGKSLQVVNKDEDLKIALIGKNYLSSSETTTWEYCCIVAEGNIKIQAAPTASLELKTHKKNGSSNIISYDGDVSISRGTYDLYVSNDNNNLDIYNIVGNNVHIYSANIKAEAVNRHIGKQAYSIYAKQNVDLGPLHKMTFSAIGYGGAYGIRADEVIIGHDLVVDMANFGEVEINASTDAVTPNKPISASHQITDGNWSDSTVLYSHLKDPLLFNVIVENGTGSGTYRENEDVIIEANAAPKGKVFKEWKFEHEVLEVRYKSENEDHVFPDKSKTKTSFFMPMHDLKVRAIYEDLPSSDRKWERIPGSDRIATAIKISEKYYPNANRVIIARHDKFPDSLAAGVLAKVLNAPLLLTYPTKLDPRVKTEIERLKASDIVIVGGLNSIQSEVEKELKAYDSDIERIAGTDRYETSARVAKSITDIVGKKGKAIIASGEDFPDALAIGPYAAQEGYPILLVKKENIDESVKKAITNLNVVDVYIVGGENTISKKLEKELPNLIERIGGKNRYHTATLIAENKFGSANEAYIASGEIFADALVIGAIAGRDSKPILLTLPNSVPSPITDYLKTSTIDKLIIVGGDNTISNEIIKILIKK